MKNLILGLLVAVFLVPAFQGVPSANADTADDVLFDVFTRNCERAFKGCYNDKTLAEEAINEAQSAPPEDVAAVCRAFCNSGNLGDLRNTRTCSDEQCEDRCEFISGILDNQIMALIDERDLKGLHQLCL